MVLQSMSLLIGQKWSVWQEGAGPPILMETVPSGSVESVHRRPTELSGCQGLKKNTTQFLVDVTS